MFNNTLTYSPFRHVIDSPRQLTTTPTLGSIDPSNKDRALGQVSRHSKGPSQSRFKEEHVVTERIYILHMDTVILLAAQKVQRVSTVRLVSPVPCRPSDAEADRKHLASI